MIAVSDDVFQDYREFCKYRLGVTIVEKKNSKLMKAVAKVLFFNKKFMTDYITTIGTTIYWPDADKLSGQDFPALFHEAQHVYDFKEMPSWFVFSYLLPHVLAFFALFSLLALTGSLWWLLFLLFILLLAPVPSRRRTFWEGRGYSCNMAYAVWTDGYVPHSLKLQIRENFTSSAYYFMWPFPRSVDLMLEQIEEDIQKGSLTPVQKVTRDFLIEHDALETR
jgi:hypothetical protein